MMIEIDFDVHKEITARRASEAVTPNDVLREIFKLSPRQISTPQSGGVFYKGVHFPEGTQFRAMHKGKTYKTEIKNGSYQGLDGTEYSSPSRAAMDMTGTSLNGWTFWECKRPSDAEWKLMDTLRT